MTAFTIPTLETERLILRAMRVGDFPRVRDYFTDPASRFTGGPADDIDSWRGMAQAMGQWVLRGFGMFALEDKARGLFIGATGGFRPIDWPENEIGWWLHPDARGHGFITEAARRARSWLYAERGWTTAVSYIVPDNAASQRVAERLGAVVETEIALRGERTLVYRHPAPDADVEG